MIAFRILQRFLPARDGNVLITFALAAVPIVFTLGATADYGYAVKSRTQMNAAADAAALAAVTPDMMKGTFADAVIRATSVFNAQASNLTRVNYDPLNLKVGLGANDGDAAVNNKVVRTITVSYTASSQNAFAKVLNMNTISISGSSTATAAKSPNIDFYLMLDTSPSMAIPATQDGIDRMVSFTKYQDGGTKAKPVGCAFACHEKSPSSETMGTRSAPKFGNPGCADEPLPATAGPCRDNWWLSQNPPDGKAAIQLRSDLVNLAVQNLVDTAQTSATQTGAIYQLAGYTFDDDAVLRFPLQLPTASTKTQAQSGINMLIVDHENSDNGDQNTVFDSSTDSSVGAFPRLQAAMKAAYNGAGAGNGTKTLGDHPQQVLMIVTDGVSDQPYNGSRIYAPLGGTTTLGSMSTQTCTDIKKNTNVRIAVLYLYYTPLPLNGGNSWYAKTVSKQETEITPTMSNCASPGLFYQVNVGGDISTALSNLFSLAVKSARLSN